MPRLLVLNDLQLSRRVDFVERFQIVLGSAQQSATSGLTQETTRTERIIDVHRSHINDSEAVSIVKDFKK